MIKPFKELRDKMPKESQESAIKKANAILENPNLLVGRIPNGIYDPNDVMAGLDRCHDLDHEETKQLIEKYHKKGI